MKLLFDNNLSHKLVARLNELFPKSSHVMLENLDEASDTTIWNFAKSNDFVIVTKDNDFHELSVIKGFPPKVIWLSIGNCRISDIEKTLSKQQTILQDFHQNNKLGFIEIGC